ncbi:MAG TPA: bifunctional DNA primase/polymerase, partial [Acidobacteriaceae bacterium]|nr:bifunctional DNA primase/polymerase [Acidobacteriaceae bacterium]
MALAENGARLHQARRQGRLCRAGHRSLRAPMQGQNAFIHFGVLARRIIPVSSWSSESELTVKNDASRNQEIDAAHPRLPAALTSEMSRLFSSGYSLVPLGGPDGKKPIVAFRDRKRFPLGLVIERMGAAASCTFGIRLKGLLVVDVDTDTPQARKYVKKRFGTSPFVVRTSRGYHMYFRHAGPKPPKVRLSNIAIDFKSGDNEFVVGPQSQRPDGTVYTAENPLVAAASLPIFEDRHAVMANGPKPPIEKDGRIQEGERHSALKRHARELISTAATLDQFTMDLLAFRDRKLDEPGNFADEQVSNLAHWFWEKREKGELWAGRDS